MTENQHSVPYFTISELKDIQSGQLLSIKVRFYKSTCPIKEVQMLDGEMRRCLENCIVVDDTGSFPLTLWGDQIDTTNGGVCYSISNLKIKTYLGATNLSTTPDTQFQQITQDFPQVGCLPITYILPRVCRVPLL